MIHTYALDPTKPATPDASSNHNQTTLLHSSPYRRAVRGSSRRCLSSTANDGSSQTRWWTQVIGLTRHAVSPVTANAAVQSPARTAVRALTAQTASTASTSSAQSARLGSCGATTPGGAEATPCLRDGGRDTTGG
ncbi:hypothetical protein GCM10027075_62100 [Streptomyces heilongjiangensis]